MQFDKSKINIAIIGLGYVGLPLAVEFSKKFAVIGFDINTERIGELTNGHDRTQEISSEILKKTTNLLFSTELEAISDCNIFIITVPTPIDKYKKPDLKPLISASRTVGRILKKGDIVIYESTVYPGCTEEDCVPILEQESGLKFNKDFYCGYSPERINPGDKEHTVANIRKVTSGSTPEIAEYVDQLYLSIITAGTFKAASLKVAEAAKVIENCQRDINIAFVNELALIFQKMNIDTKSVLEAAGSKWNFLKFSPGLVGGHCIGVDPYYLTHKAESLGYNPQVILAGRRINDNMGKYVAGQIVKLLFKKDVSIKNASILVLGITFKENCPDIRNSRVIDIIEELQDYQLNVEVFDPWADSQEVQNEYNINLIDKISWEKYSGVVLAVSHNQFVSTSFLKDLNNYNGVIYDVKSILDKDIITERL
jgi:UDP-N-acetyl-D-glucosamine/UDP-N-acetyl-D-galactosamine dehydrogenase